jgi:hypothetical protein
MLKTCCMSEALISVTKRFGFFVEQIWSDVCCRDSEKTGEQDADIFKLAAASGRGLCENQRREKLPLASGRHSRSDRPATSPRMSSMPCFSAEIGEGMTDHPTSLPGFETIAGPDLRDGGLQMHGRCLKGRHGFQPVRCIIHILQR